jgi:hypothetical protein
MRATVREGVPARGVDQTQTQHQGNDGKSDSDRQAAEGQGP